MLEGLPPNNASHAMQLVCDERAARAIVDIVVETFDPAETAACAFEAEDDRNWAVEVFFGEEPDEARVRALIEAVANGDLAAAARILASRRARLGFERVGRIEAGARRARARAWRA